MNDQWFAYSATACDPLAAQLRTRGHSLWWKALSRRGWALPEYFVFDAGVLLLRPEAAARLSAPAEAYSKGLLLLSQDYRFRTCAYLIQQAPSELQDEAIIVTIQAISRHLRRGLLKRNLNSPESWNNLSTAQVVGELLRETVSAMRSGHFLSPVDALTAKAATRIPRGHKLLDYPLLDECVREVPPLWEHVVRWRRIPTKIVGTRDLSRQPGNGGGYTALRCRIPQDELHDILPSEWALFEVDESLGLDKLLNRRPLVPQKEAPHDFVPYLRILVVFIVEEAIFSSADNLLWKGEVRLKRKHQYQGILGKALVYRMVHDLANQVPEDQMSVDVGIFVRPYRQNNCCVSACFALRSVPKGEDRFTQMLSFDELVPGYFFVNNLGTTRLHTVHGAASATHDPYVLLSTASSAAGYTATFAVIVNTEANVSRLLPTFPVTLRPPEAGRNAVLVIEVRGRDNFGLATFRDLLQAHGLTSSGLNEVSELDVRAALLTMIFGPQKGALARAEHIATAPDRATSEEWQTEYYNQGSPFT